jgi:hypothetical protein
MTQQVRRQHVVSQFYLKGFANEQSRIARVELPGDQRIVLTTKDASVVKDFYTVTFPNGTETDMFEKALGEVEGVAAEAFRKIETGVWPLAPGDHGALAAWIALQHLRSQDIRSSQTSMYAEMLRLIVGVSGKEALRTHMQAETGAKISDDELDWEWGDLTKPGGPTIADSALDHIATIVDLLPGMAAMLDDMHWTLIEFQRRAIITSDLPVSMFPGRDHPRWSGVGIATAGSFVVPISRRRVLLVQHRKDLARPGMPEDIPDSKVPGVTGYATQFNQSTAAAARRYVFHHPDDTPLHGIRLPEPRSYDQGNPGVDRMVREEGLFAGVSEDGLKAMSGMTDPDEGMSLEDVPWPIPRRVMAGRPDFEQS